jgi:hypothetical protein
MGHQSKPSPHHNRHFENNVLTQSSLFLSLFLSPVTEISNQLDTEDPSPAKVQRTTLLSLKVTGFFQVRRESKNVVF